jgi:hypothetical protein
MGFMNECGPVAGSSPVETDRAKAFGAAMYSGGSSGTSSGDTG